MNHIYRLSDLKVKQGYGVFPREGVKAVPQRSLSGKANESNAMGLRWA